MNSKQCITLFVLLVIFYSGFSSCNNSSEEILFSIENKQISHFSEVGRIEKVIKPESSYNALFITANRVRVDAAKHLFILDKESNKIFHFDSEGKFLNKYGRIGQGPGEYNSLFGFDIDSSGNVILLTLFKLIKFKKTGEFISEKKINVFSADIKSIGNELFVYVLRNRKNGSRHRNSINVYDSNLNLKRGVGSYDKRLVKYIFSSTAVLDGSDTQLFFIDLYELSLEIYNINTNKLIIARFPNRNERLENIWKKSALIEDDRTEIKKQIHRFSQIFYYQNGIYLLETNRGLNIYNFWLIDLKSNKINTYPYFTLVNDPTKPVGNLFFDYIAGSYENGLILIFDDCKRFNKYKSRFPELNKINFSEHDNSLVVFLKLNK